MSGRCCTHTETGCFGREKQRSVGVGSQMNPTKSKVFCGYNILGILSGKQRNIAFYLKREANLLHEIFVTCLFRDFEVRIFHDTQFRDFAKTLYFESLWFRVFEHHNLHFINSNNKAVLTMSTSSSCLHVNYCSWVNSPQHPFTRKSPSYRKNEN